MTVIGQIPVSAQIAASELYCSCSSAQVVLHKLDRNQQQLAYALRTAQAPGHIVDQTQQESWTRLSSQILLSMLIALIIVFTDFDDCFKQFKKFKVSKALGVLKSNPYIVSILSSRKKYINC